MQNRVYVICIYVFIAALIFFLNISASRECSVFSHIVRLLLNAPCSARVASKINENCIVTG